MAKENCIDVKCKVGYIKLKTSLPHPLQILSSECSPAEVVEAVMAAAGRKEIRQFLVVTPDQSVLSHPVLL